MKGAIAVRLLLKAAMLLLVCHLTGQVSSAALSSTNRGTGGNNTAATTLSVVPGSNFTAGSTAVLVIATDNAGSAGSTPVCPSTLSGPNSMSWTIRQNPINDPGAASAGAELCIYTALVTTFATTDTLTVSWAGSTSVTAKAYTLTEVTAAAGSSIGYVTGNTTTGSSTTPSITTGTIVNGDMVIGGLAAEGNATITADSDTSNGSWSTQQTTGFGATTSAMEVGSQTKVVTASATQTYNLTITSADWAMAWIELTEIPPGMGKRVTRM